MKCFGSPSQLGLLALGCGLLWGCKGHAGEDLTISSVANPSHTLRATIIQRQYFIEGRLDTSPTTYVLLDEDTGKPNYENGEEFKSSQIVMQPSQCGPLSVAWDGDNTLKITCEKCGLAQSALGPHPRVMSAATGTVRIDYEAFPELSSWEGGARGR